jgi:hypothetical protein
MSETVTTEQAGGGGAAPVEEYQPTHVLSSEPDGGEQAQPEQQQPADVQQQADGQPQADGGGEAAETESQRIERERASINRRLGQVTRQKYLERERANQLERELQALRAQYNGGGQATNDGLPDAWMNDPRVQQYIEARAAEEARVRAFVQAGAQEFPDWDTRRSQLIELGADQELAKLLVEMPGGHRVAGALYEQPEELERIVEMRSPTARAMALGQLSARLEARRTVPPVPPRRASPLPPPHTPPPAARSAPAAPDPEKGSMEEFERWSRSLNWSNR